MPAAPSSRIAATRDASVSPPESVAVRSLRGPVDFDRVLRTGRRRRRGGVTVVSAPGIPGTTRIGLIAGRRVGGAVERNRAKRRIRQAVGGLRLPAGTDLVVIASPAVVTADFQDLVGWLRSAIGHEE